MASYQRMVENYLASYQPTTKKELEQQGSLPNYLDEQAEVMQAAKARVLAQLKERAPQLSPLQLDMEAERTVIETFLTPP